MDDDGWLILILGALGLLALASALMNKPSVTQTVSAPAKTLQPIMSNEETWKWQDWTGKSRSITIHRIVKTNGSA
jgi:hypothetical protein